MQLIFRDYGEFAPISGNGLHFYSYFRKIPSKIGNELHFYIWIEDARRHIRRIPWIKLANEWSKVVWCTGKGGVDLTRLKKHSEE